VRQRATGEFNSVDSTALLQVAVVFFIFILFIVFYKRLSRDSINEIYFSPLRWFFLLYVFGFISSIWSPLFNYSFYRAFEALVLFFGVYIYFNANRFEFDFEKIFLRFNLAILLMTFIGQLKLYGFRISIDTLHTNSYSLIALILFLYSFSELMSKIDKDYERKKMLTRYSIIGFIFLALGTSSASNISAVIGIVLLLIFTNRKDLKVLTFAGIILIIPVFFYFISFDDLMSVLLPGKTVESISSLTGRTNLWMIYVDSFLEHPYIGWGFAVLARISEHATTNTHNSILSIATGMGVTGLVLFFLFFFSSIYKFFKNRTFPIVGIIGGGIAIISALVNSMSIAILGESVSPPTLSLVSLIAYYYININTFQRGYKI
jgi:O-antigen ligase